MRASINLSNTNENNKQNSENQKKKKKLNEISFRMIESNVVMQISIVCNLFLSNLNLFTPTQWFVDACIRKK